MRYITRSLMVKLVASFLLVALLPIGIVGYLSFRTAKQALREARLAALASARDQGKQHIREYLDMMLSDMKYQAKNPGVQSVFKDLYVYLDYAAYLDYAKEHRDAPVDIQSEEYKKTLADIDPVFLRFLDNFQAERGYEDILLIVGDSLGLIMYTGKKLSDLGASVTEGALKESALGKVWAKVMKTHKPALADFTTYAPSGSVSGFLGVPVFSNENKFYGVAVLRFGPKQISEHLNAIGQVGKTGDAVVVGRNMLARSSSRFTPQGILTQRIDTEAAREGLAGHTGLGEISGVGGVPVLNAWAPVGISAKPGLGADFDWSMIAKIDSREAFEDVRRLGKRIIGIGALIGLVVAILAFFVVRRLAKPISNLAAVVAQVSQGDLTAHVPKLNRTDEVGQLANTFGTMVDNLRQQIRAILDGVNVLVASAAEISATLSQVSVSTAKTSAAVTETVTTVEQLRQAAKLSGEKAKHVARSSLEAANVSEAGKQATHDTAQRMEMIRQQMESIGETVIRLSDHGQAIEAIIAVVQDLADQSNLLAVNASIEAARAGEQGKGFAVVAQEIKSLADQSRQATEQVRTILHDTRKWVNAVVMATEQGGKAVQAGVEQSEVAGQSINALAKGIVESSQAAAVIDSSSQQQFAGVDQVSLAMANIGQAMKQNLDGTTELEAAAKRLDELGAQLRKLVERYRV